SASLRGDSGSVRLERDGAAPRTLALPVHEALRAAAADDRLPEPPRALPPFHGGWVGCFAYEWCGTLEPRVRAARERAGVQTEEAEADFRFFPTVVAFDHAAQKLALLRRCPQGAAGHAAALAHLEALAADLDTEPPAPGVFRLLDAEPSSSMDRRTYEEGVTRLQREIAQGEVFQAVLARRLAWRCEGDLFALYRVLRLVNPAPHMFYYESAGRTLIGSSPERLVSVRGRLVQNRPIAGTRPRSNDEAEDQRLAAELMADRKERAEHDMLVDLGRNDLGRIARTGTVRVVEHAALEKFARVQHLVSRIECELAAPYDALDALAAAFPAGTVSGAPKVRAMELLAELEPVARGAYAGAFGYLDGSGNLDTAIILRTIVAREDADGLRVMVQAGAGVVHDSVPAREYEETVHKGSALAEALRLTEELSR
ncbi:MAG: anthranilate synthase component I family protein, partial [Planctomycetota bacterium]|nr:anthranilate synthase component I family protein [Planctomycetota bacterium]